jgi:hypothetical protein
VRRWSVAALSLIILTAACGDDDGAGTTVTAGTNVTSTTAAEPAATTTTAAPSTTTEPPTTTTAPSTTTQPPATGPEPAPSITLNDPALAVEPADTSYRAALLFTMRAELDDGSVQEGIVTGDGGKLLDPAEVHAFVVDVEGLSNLPDCFDIAAASPNYVSAYHTFYGGLSGDAGGDLTGEALLLEAGITTNGVTVDRFAITLENIQAGAESEYVSLTEAYIDIARDGGYLVRLALNGTGRNNTFTVDQTEPRQIRYQLDFSEFGQITEFTIPAGCAS